MKREERISWVYQCPRSFADKTGSPRRRPTCMPIMYIRCLAACLRPASFPLGVMSPTTNLLLTDARIQPCGDPTFRNVGME